MATTRHASQPDPVDELRLTDDGLEVPEGLVGYTGAVEVVKPNISKTVYYSEPGVAEIDREMVVFPTTGNAQRTGVPPGYVRIQGDLYEIVDDRDLDECPHCESEKVAACDTPVFCYGCDTTLEEVTN